MKPVTLKNIRNGEKLICQDTRSVQTIDGVEYLVVHRPGNLRSFLMRKEVLTKDAAPELKSPYS